MEKFVEYIEEEVKQLYAKFPQQPMTELSDVLKREHKAAERCHICPKEFNDPQNKKITATTRAFFEGQPIIIAM